MKFAAWQSRAVVTMALSLSVVASHAQSTTPKEASDELRLAIMIGLKAIEATKQAKNRVKKTCEIPSADGRNECPIAIEMVPLPPQGPQVPPVPPKSVCVALAPDVKVTTNESADEDVKIHWVLQVQDPQVPAQNFSFHPNHGLLIFNADPKLGLKVLPGAADKVSVASSPKERGAKAHYLPVILLSTSDGPEMCAAIDPKIVNG